MQRIKEEISDIFEPVPGLLDRAVEGIVLRDLCPEASTVHAKVGTAAILGGLAALALCGQFGLGLTDFAQKVSHEMHEQMGALPCALICGSFYAIFPVLFLRFTLCSALQFKVLARSHRGKIAVWLGGCGALLAGFGHHGASLLQLGLWLFSALFMTVVLVRLTERIKWTGPWAVYMRDHRSQSL